MQNRNEILNELREVAPLIESISQKNVYTVPANYFESFADEIMQIIGQPEISFGSPKPAMQVPGGYFEGLAEGIMQKIKAGAALNQTETYHELEEVAPFLNTINKTNLYTIPGGYFEDLAEHILIRNTVMDELAETAPLLNTVSRQNLFSVPEGYFEGLAEKIISENRATDSAKSEVYFELQEVAPLLNSITNKNPYTVNANFFEGLAEDISAKNKLTVDNENEVFIELKAVAPLLNTISRQNVYTMPVGYFENLSIPVPAEAKIVSMPANRKWYRYAAAASVAAIMLFAGLTWFKANNGSSTDFKTLANTNVQKEISTIADTDIISYLDQQPVVADVVSTSMEEQDPDVNESIQNATNDEIQNYLKDNTEPGEDENVIKKI